MSDVLASFRELSGIGPAIEAKLHDAGVYTWVALSEVVSALGNVRGSNGDTLRDLSVQLADRASAAGGGPTPPLPSGERSEAFIVRMSLAADGVPTRSTATHVRTQTEMPWAGWAPEDVIRFIEDQASIVAVAPAVSAGGSVTPAPAFPPAPADTPSRDHIVVVDVGKVIGGVRRSIEIALSTGRVKPRAEFEYRATLAARPYGQIATVDPAWTNLGESAGRGHPPDRLPLRFEAVVLPPGVQRLKLQMMLRLSSPTRHTPTLELG